MSFQNLIDTKWLPLLAKVYVVAVISLGAGVALCENEKNINSYSTYDVDWEPFKKHRVLHRLYTKLHENKAPSLLDLKQRTTIINTIMQRQPDYLDGYWMAAEKYLEYGSAFDSGDKERYVRSLFEKSRRYANLCLQKKPDHALCKFFLGAAIGKLATIDGVMSSLSKAKKIESLWLEVIESRVNHKFWNGASLQGLTHYGLGMFHRLIPDFFLIRWTFGLDTDISRAVAYHERAIEIDGGGGTCYTLMLAAAKLCRDVGSDRGDSLKRLQLLSERTSASRGERVCLEGAKSLHSNPANACGYTIAKVQDLDESQIKKK